MGRRSFIVVGHCHHPVLSSNLTDIGWLWPEQTGRATGSANQLDDLVLACVGDGVSRPSHGRTEVRRIG
jgi:hypothetical protein